MSMTEGENKLMSLMANLDVHIGHLTEQQKRTEQRTLQYERARQAEQPRWIDVAGTAVADANGLAIITLNNSPDSGHFWYIRKLAVGGLSPTTTASGRCDVYRGQALNRLSTLAGMGMGGWEDFTITLPSIAVYGEGEIVVAAPEEVFVVITGGTTGQEYVATGRIQDFQDAAYGMKITV